MTRSEIESTYTIANGIIRSPGKFEAEAIFAPYFYAATLDGCSEILDYPDGGRVDIVEIDSDDRAMFPEIQPEHVAAIIEENDSGFVSVVLATEDEIESQRRNCEDACEAEGDEDGADHYC